MFFPIQNTQILNIDSTVKTVNADYYGKARFPHYQDKASAYFCYLIKDHPVIDGNKRIALLWLEIYCHINNLKINPAIHLDELAILVEREKIDLYTLSVRVKQILFK